MRKGVAVRSGLAFALSLAAVLGGNAPAVHAAAEAWTTAGAAGTLDEAAEGVLLNDGAAFFIDWDQPGAEPGQRMLRYNVVPVDGLFGGGGAYLKVRYWHMAAEDRVTVILYEQDLRTGVRRERIRFDTRDHPAIPYWQSRTTRQCNAGWTFDFGNNAYVVEASLGMGPERGGSALAAIQIGRYTCQ
jgi:hypothetical protein